MNIVTEFFNVLKYTSTSEYNNSELIFSDISQEYQFQNNKQYNISNHIKSCAQSDAIVAKWHHAIYFKKNKI